jgi:hypothetical protein
MGALETFLARDTRIHEGTEEWKAIVNAKVDALDVPGTIMEFTPEEIEFAGFVPDAAFDDPDLDLEVEAANAMAALALRRLSAKERQELHARARVERLPDVGAGEEDAWIL